MRQEGWMAHREMVYSKMCMAGERVTDRITCVRLVYSRNQPQ